MNEVYAFEVSVIGTNWRKVVNDRTAGRAKADYWRDVKEAWPDVPFTAMRAHKLGSTVSTPGAISVAKYRGRPELKCGVRVRAESGTGRIVDGNSSANFDVLFDDDSPRYPGMKLNCHPAYIEVID